MKPLPTNPIREMQDSAKTAGAETEDKELFKLNQVYYRSIPSLSTVTKRTLVRSNFQKRSYTDLSNQTIQCIINTGELFVNGPQSFLNIQFGINLSALPDGVLDGNDEPKSYDVHAFLGPGGILGVIDEVWLTSSSGTEICREQNKGLQIAHYLHNTLQPEYVRRNGIVEGLPGPNYTDNFSGRGYTQDAIDPATVNINTTGGPVFNRRGAYYSGGVDDDNAGDLKLRQPTILNDQGLCEVTYWSADTGNYAASTAPYFSVPMSHLLGCFNPYMKVLFPGIALAGATLSIRFKNLVEPLIMTGAGLTHRLDNSPAAVSRAKTITTFAAINDIYINWDSYQMNDAVVKKINDISAGKDGLTMMYDTFDWAMMPVTGTQIEAQVSQARSRIKMSFCVVRDPQTINNPFVPSLCSEAGTLREVGPYTAGVASGDAKILSAPISDIWSTIKPPTVIKYQAILGSLFFPQQPSDTLTDLYYNQLYIFGKNYRDDTDLSCLSLEDFAGGKGNQVFDDDGKILAPGLKENWCFPYGMAVYGMTAERSSLLQLTGLTVSNARLLRHEFTFSPPPTYMEQGRQIDIFTQFTRQAKVFLGGRIVVRE